MSRTAKEIVDSINWEISGLHEAGKIDLDARVMFAALHVELLKALPAEPVDIEEIENEYIKELNGMDNPPISQIGAITWLLRFLTTNGYTITKEKPND